MPRAQKAPPKSRHLKRIHSLLYNKQSLKTFISYPAKNSTESYATLKLCCVGECHLTSKILTGETEGYFQVLLICGIKHQLPLVLTRHQRRLCSLISTRASIAPQIRRIAIFHRQLLPQMTPEGQLQVGKVSK